MKYDGIYSQQVETKQHISKVLVRSYLGFNEDVLTKETA